MSRLCIIGDVHGMLESLQSLINKLDLQPADKLIFVGDLIDKGPDSAGVVQYVDHLQQKAPNNVILVEGNHEDRMRRYLRNLTVRPAVAKEQSERAPELKQLEGQLNTNQNEFLNWSVPFYRCDVHGILVVHGGIPGTMQEFPISVEEANALTGKAAKKFEKIFRTRFLDEATGDVLAFEKEGPGDPFWAEQYDGRFGHVVFGHHPFLDGPREFSHATGIDTGAVHGGGLTALIYAPNQPQYFVTVETECHLAARSA